MNFAYYILIWIVLWFVVGQFAKGRCEDNNDREIMVSLWPIVLLLFNTLYFIKVIAHKIDSSTKNKERLP